MSVLREAAPAKVNLTLRVLGRRADGFHELSSLVAFAGVGDELALEPGEGLSLAIAGDEGRGLAEEGDNLVLRAARALAVRLPGIRLGRFHLIKHLPVASGIGGGSSDAAAALRLLARANGIPPDDPRLRDAAESVGSDVPVCLDPAARVMEGRGERLGAPLGLPPLHAVLVNPRVGVATHAVFHALGLAPGSILAANRDIPPQRAGRAAMLAFLRASANDLEPAALGLEPGIGAVMEAASGAGAPDLVRMSGSGATVFALHGGADEAAAAARRLGADHPGWWVVATVLR